MRKMIAVATCAAVLLVAGASSAMAGGPHHHRGGPRHGHGFRPPVKQHWNSGFRGPVAPYCAPRPVVAYPAPVYPAYPAYGGFGSTFGFGVAARNFSMWFQQ